MKSGWEVLGLLVTCLFSLGVIWMMNRERR
jgi:hypothetical protein